MPKQQMPAPADFGGEPETKKNTKPALRVVEPEESAPVPATKTNPRPPVRTLSLGGLAKSGTPKKKETIHPVAHASEELAALVEQFCQEKPMYDQLEGSLKALRKQILEIVAPQILSLPGTEYSMIANGPSPIGGPNPVDGIVPVRPGLQSKILVTLQNRYSGIDYATGWDQMVELIGLDKTEENFTQGVSLKIDMNKVPDAHRQELLNRLLPIFQEFGLTEPPEGTDGGDEPAVVAKEILIPKPDFHSMRRARLTSEENAKIQELMPAIGVIKVKNVKR
jgi:hypothetical protein